MSSSPFGQICNRPWYEPSWGERCASLATGDAEFVGISDAADKATEGPSVHGRVIRGIHVHCVLSVASVTVLSLIYGCCRLADWSAHMAVFVCRLY